MMVSAHSYLETTVSVPKPSSSDISFWLSPSCRRISRACSAVIFVISYQSHGGERCGNVGAMIPAGMVERGERKRNLRPKRGPVLRMGLSFQSPPVSYNTAAWLQYHHGGASASCRWSLAVHHDW